MAYKTILVHVDGSDGTPARVALAGQIALDEGAHLIGSAMTGISPFLMPFGAFDQGMPALQVPIETLRAESIRALDAFERQARAASVVSLGRRCVDDDAGIGICMQARHADLVVIGQGKPLELPLLSFDLPAYVLLHCARPVLVVPAVFRESAPARRILIGWNGSASAARAITGALPLLRRAEWVQVAMFNTASQTDLTDHPAGSEMVGYLSRHGVRAEAHAMRAERDAGTALLAHAASSGYGLVVMGAYGHSRAREILLGGATRRALRNTALPLLMAH